jgi:hypothetical protein
MTMSNYQVLCHSEGTITKLPTTSYDHAMDVCDEAIEGGLYDTIGVYEMDRAAPKGVGLIRSWGRDFDLITGVAYDA